MKLSKLHIDQFRHLENLDFDFTYAADFHDESKFRYGLHVGL